VKATDGLSDCRLMRAKLKPDDENRPTLRRER
jgi:hypothetical protein